MLGAPNGNQGRGDGQTMSHVPKFDFESGIHKASEVERELILQALEYTGGNVAQAARLIDMQRSSLRHRISKHGLGPGMWGGGQ